MTPWNPRTAGCLEAVAVGVVLLLLPAMLGGAPVSAQTPEQSSAGEGGTVAGRAIDFRNTPVVDATVFVTPDAGQTASTDSEGRFRLAGVPAGRYTIEVRTSELRGRAETTSSFKGQRLTRWCSSRGGECRGGQWAAPPSARRRS